MKGKCPVNSGHRVSLQVYAAVRLKPQFFWDVTPNRQVIGPQTFEGMYSLYLQGCAGPRRRLVPEDEVTMFIRNVANRLPNDAASHPKTMTLRERVCVVNLNCRNLQLFCFFSLK